MSLMAQKSRSDQVQRRTLNPCTFSTFAPAPFDWRDEKIDDVHAAPIDDRGDGAAIDIVETAAEQREAL